MKKVLAYLSIITNGSDTLQYFKYLIRGGGAISTCQGSYRRKDENGSNF